MAGPNGRFAAASLCALSLFFVLAPARPAGAVPPADRVPSAPAVRAGIGSHDLCGVDVEVTNNGRFTSLYAPQSPDAPFDVSVGLWVGAVADVGDGSGPQPHVSAGLYSTEFWPPDASRALPATALPGSGPAGRPRPVDIDPALVHAHYDDTFTADFLPDHVPLGLDVVQESFPVLSTGGVHYVDVKLTIRNISAEYAPPGWTLHDVAMGILADPDVGQGDGVNTWNDDLGGFASARGPGATAAPGARRGDLAYMYDTPGGGDDVDTQVGLVLRGRPVHAFRIWSGGSGDPVDDADRYARLRGAPDGSPRIDDPAFFPSDYRILISTGTVGDLAPGESVTFGFSMACGALVPGVAPEPAPEPVAPALVARDRVVSRASGRVAFEEAPGAVEIFAVTGRRVARVEGAAGWDFRTRDGGAAPAGVYFWRRADGPAGVAGKIVLTR